jgi:hypothetical protein
MSLGSMRVSKRTWYAQGGFANSRCWRRQVGGSWRYFITIDRWFQ